MAGPFSLALFAALAVAAAGGGPNASEPTDAAVADIPAEFLVLYQEAAAGYELDWAVLAGIGKVECDHGRSQLAGCNPPGTINSAGARGPMQFLGSTWRAGAGQYDLDVAGPATPAGSENQGYATDGDADGVADPWQPADAIWAAARLLHRNGAPANYHGAIWAYNHSDSYRMDVMRWAETYRSAANPGPVGVPVDGPVPLTEVRGIVVHTEIAGPLDAMIAAAAADGVTLDGRGYRSHAEQIALREAHCGTGHYNVFEKPASRCNPPTARPGASMHEQGLAIDFFNCSARSTACWQWLDANAATFGFFNLPSEPWHWSTDGS